jgi:pyruvate/2-oxoglutarate dehydrogenase complex dihydrolipoamide acyltransferase (E2) component
VSPGSLVHEGETVAVLEAMKMELALKAPFAGTVASVGATPGQQVVLGAELLRVLRQGPSGPLGSGSLDTAPLGTGPPSGAGP